jgi:hypothetical protein
VGERRSGYIFCRKALAFLYSRFFCSFFFHPILPPPLVLAYFSNPSSKPCFILLSLSRISDQNTCRSIPLSHLTPGSLSLSLTPYFLYISLFIIIPLPLQSEPFLQALLVLSPKSPHPLTPPSFILSGNSLLTVTLPLTPAHHSEKGIEWKEKVRGLEKGVCMYVNGQFNII